METTEVTLGETERHPPRLRLRQPTLRTVASVALVALVAGLHWHQAQQIRMLRERIARAEADYLITEARGAEITALRGRVDALEPLVDRVDALQTGVQALADDHMVDLTVSGYQLVGRDFYIARLEKSLAAGGVRLRGEVVNKTTVTHHGASFSIAWESGSAKIWIPQVRPGRGAPFTVLLPKAPASLGEARVDYQSSSTSWYPESD